VRWLTGSSWRGCLGLLIREDGLRHGGGGLALGCPCRPAGATGRRPCCIGTCQVADAAASSCVEIELPCGLWAIRQLSAANRATPSPALSPSPRTASSKFWTLPLLVIQISNRSGTTVPPSRHARVRPLFICLSGCRPVRPPAAVEVRVNGIRHWPAPSRCNASLRAPGLSRHSRTRAEVGRTTHTPHQSTTCLAGKRPPARAASAIQELTCNSRNRRRIGPAAQRGLC